MNRAIAILMGTIFAGAMSASAQIVAGWENFVGSNAFVPTQLDADTTVSVSATTAHNPWGHWFNLGQSASADGTFGSYGFASASTVISSGTNALTLNRSDGTLVFTLTNNSAEDRELGGFYFDCVSKFAASAKAWELSVSGAISGAASNGPASNVGGGFVAATPAQRDHAVDLTALTDNIWEAGQGIIFTLAFTGAANTGSGGGAELLVDNIAITLVVDSPPIIKAEPQDTEVVLGAAEAEFSVLALGTAPLAFQWSFGGTNLVGATNQTLTIVNPGAAELGDYSVTVTNSLGSTNSASATLSYISGPITPGNAAVVEGGIITYGVDLPQAATNYTYQWARNMGALLGKTGAELVLNPVAVGDAGNYTVDVTYDGVTETSDPVILLVAAAATNDYPTTVLANNPVAWWRLGELSGTNALDSAGSAGGPYDAVYEAAVELDKAGALLGDPDRAARFDGTATSMVTNDYIGALNPSGSFSVEAWALIEGSAGSQRNVVYSYDNSVSDEKWGYQLKATAANRWRFTTGGFAPAVNDLDGPVVVPFEWTHLVGVYDDAAGTIELYVNGFASGAKSVTSFNPIDPDPRFIVPFTIGEDFDGLIDEVAFYNSVLSQADVLEHYAAGLPADAPPQFSLEPGDEVRNIGGEVTFTVVVRASGQPTFQWQKDGIDISGATLTSLTLTNLVLTDAGGYRVLADIAGNVVTSAVGNLSIREAGLLVLNPDDDGELKNDGSVLGTQTTANIKNVGSANSLTRKAIYRFDLSGFVSGTADAGSSIQFSLSSTNGYNYTSSNNELTLWGLNDGSSGESWDPLTITYLTAPGNDTSSGSGMLVGAGGNQVANLGSFGWGPVGAVGDVFTVSGAALAAFLNADTDNQATFYLSRTGGDPTELSLNFILGTVENTTAARRPVLSIVTIPVGPVLDPVSISLQGGLPEISWTDTGTLQRNEDLNNEAMWTDLPDETSPYTPLAGATNQFFRLKE